MNSFNLLELPTQTKKQINLYEENIINAIDKFKNDVIDLTLTISVLKKVIRDFQLKISKLRFLLKKKPNNSEIASNFARLKTAFTTLKADLWTYQEKLQNLEIEFHLLNGDLMDWDAKINNLLLCVNELNCESNSLFKFMSYFFQKILKVFWVWNNLFEKPKSKELIELLHKDEKFLTDFVQLKVDYFYLELGIRAILAIPVVVLSISLIPIASTTIFPTIAGLFISHITISCVFGYALSLDLNKKVNYLIQKYTNNESNQPKILDPILVNKLALIEKIPKQRHQALIK